MRGVLWQSKYTKVTNVVEYPEWVLFGTLFKNNKMWPNMERWSEYFVHVPIGPGSWVNFEINISELSWALRSPYLGWSQLSQWQWTETNGGNCPPHFKLILGPNTLISSVQYLLCSNKLIVILSCKISLLSCVCYACWLLATLCLLILSIASWLSLFWYF